jgi:hypothetical protein
MAVDSVPITFSLSGWIGGVAAADAGVEGGAGGGGITVDPTCFSLSGWIGGAGDEAAGVLGADP